MTIFNDAGLVLTERLRVARLSAGLDQAQIAKRLGVARQTVSNWERGIAEPSASYFVLWARATGQSLDWLAEGVHDKAPAGAGANVRHEGFEPPTFWSVASLAPLLLALMRERVTR